MKVAILGFGIEGQDAARYFLARDAEITVFDEKSEVELVRGSWRTEGIRWVTGKDYLLQGLEGFDLIVRSPGFYRYHPKLLAAEKSGSKITSTTILFFEKCETPIIGVTGTKGKGTTSRMLNLALRKGGYKTVLAGNIGEPMLEALPKANRADWVVLELSSFQTIDLTTSPKIVVVTKITVDHLDWHKDREEYVRAKENLWKHQTGEEFVVFNFDDETCRKLAPATVGQEFYFSIKQVVDKGAYADASGKVHLRIGEDTQVGDAYELAVPGKHNWANGLAALVSSVLAGAHEEDAWRGILSYKGAEHRLEKVAEKDGVVYINDSAATTPESTIAALEAYGEPKVLILGGSKKGREYDELAEAVVKNNTRAVVLIGETGPQIKKSLEEAGYEGLLKEVAADIGKIVREARKLACAGDIVLLSPSCASFDMFRNYKERGKKFKEAVLRLR